MSYLETKTKRVINRSTGNVEGIVAYAMAADFSHMVVAIAQKHPDDVNDVELGKKIATDRVSALTDPHNIADVHNVSVIWYDAPDLNIFSCGLKLQQIKETYKLRYVKLNTIMETVYNRFGICTNKYR